MLRYFFVFILLCSQLYSESDYQPKYEGVEQLLFLSNQWVVVATTNIDEVVAELDDLTKGKYIQTLQTWSESERSGKPKWGAFKDAKAMLEKWWVEARERAGEKLLDDPNFFSIQSEDDPNYLEPQHALRTTRFLTSLGNTRIFGGPPIHYAHYSYLELPYPLENGKSYTITLNNQKKVSFNYDDLHSISRAIKVNQVGYLPYAKKYAYLGAYLHELGPLNFAQNSDFELIDKETSQVVFTGPITLRAANPRFDPNSKEKNPEKRPLMIGEDLYEMDLSDFSQPGEYFIRVPGVGRSWDFKISDDVYGEAFYVTARALYHQRCGIAIKKPYSAWPRILCHTDPVYEADYIPFTAPYSAPKGYKIFDVVGATIDLSRKTVDARGGWHDAADWDRNIRHYLCVLDLLNAYEIAPQKFHDGQLNIPESGNGIPDVLDEAEYGLRPWLQSMNASGGVSGFIETWTHPKINDASVKYAYSLRTRWASLLFAGSAAQYARLVEPFDPLKAKIYREAAVKAYRFGIDPKNSLGKITIQAKTKRGKGTPYTMEWEEVQDNLKPFLLFAKIQLFALTEDSAYLKNIDSAFATKFKPYAWPFTQRDLSVWLFFGIVHGKASKILPKNLVEIWKGTYLRESDQYVKESRDQPYRQSWPKNKDFWMSWGAVCMTNQARTLLQGYVLTRDPKYLQTAIYNADYMLGENALGMVWTTGLGYVYPVEIQHNVSINDGIDDPVPGITIYGPTGSMFAELKNTVWTAKDPTQKLAHHFMSVKNEEVPVFRRWASHPKLNTVQNEFTIHETVSSTIFTYSMLMSDDWMPSEELKNRQPKPRKELHGYWYMP